MIFYGLLCRLIVKNPLSSGGAFNIIPPSFIPANDYQRFLKITEISNILYTEFSSSSDPRFTHSSLHSDLHEVEIKTCYI